MNERVAILGGGQLCFYLCNAAREMGLETVVVTPNIGSTATFSADESVEGKFDLPQWHSLLAIQDATVTFEIDEIAPELLDRLETIGNAATLAQVKVLKLLQDKTIQKRWLNQNGFLTSTAMSFTGERHFAIDFAKTHGYPIVQKVARGGYDGQGVQFFHNEADLNMLWRALSLIEVYIPFRQELTVLVARSTNEEIVCYEPVATYFNDEGHVLDHVIAPAPIPADLASRACLLAEAVISKLEGVGIYAVELFLTTDNQLLVNEISARVHNTGNHTLESTETSQYEQHLRALHGQPLGSTASRAPVTIMRNLLNGVQMLDGLVNKPPHQYEEGAAVLHWYGKKPNRYLRKMGHITASGDTLEEAWAGVRELEEQLTTWAQND